VGERETRAEAVPDLLAVAVPVAVPLPALRPLAVGAWGVPVGAPPVCEALSEAVVEGDTDTLGEREPLLLPHAEGVAEGQRVGVAEAEGEALGLGEAVARIEARGDAVAEGEAVPKATEVVGALLARVDAEGLPDEVPAPPLEGDGDSEALRLAPPEREAEPQEEAEGDGRGERVPSKVPEGLREERGEGDCAADAEGVLETDVEPVEVKERAREREGGGERVAERLDAREPEGRGDALLEGVTRSEPEPEGERDGEREALGDSVALEEREGERVTAGERVEDGEERWEEERRALGVREGGAVGRTVVDTERDVRAVLLGVPLVLPLRVAALEREGEKEARGLRDTLRDTRGEAEL
jgi:hypothetical protein